MGLPLQKIISMRILVILLGLTISILLTGCFSDPETTQQKRASGPVNPNGDSELALLMRDMFDNGMLMKEQIQNGKAPQVTFDYEAILTAHATEPDKVATEEFKTFSETFLHTMRALEKADEEEAPDLYRSMVETCMGCHKILCPGPTRRIVKMRI